MTSATIDGPYRYDLVRDLGMWDQSEKTALFIMLNPSTADHQKDDPTIRRCLSFARREDCSRLAVVNLFALRTPDPIVLLHQDTRSKYDIVGPRNDDYIIKWLSENVLAVAAWGGNNHHLVKQRAREVWAICMEIGKSLWCFGETGDGSPRHPLYLKSDSPLTPWEPR